MPAGPRSEVEQALTAPQRKVYLQWAETLAALGGESVPIGVHRESQALVEAALAEVVLRTDPTREAKARALEAIRERYIADAPHDAFGFSFDKIVFGEGDPAAEVMFIGEAPGADEDRTGRPFVGRAGEMLNKWIGAMGLKRAEVYIANVLKVRPPNNATPTISEREASKPYLLQQIAAVQPKVIVTVGLPAAQVMLETSESMGKLRSVWAKVTVPGLDGKSKLSVDVMPTYHPAYILRAPTRENRNAVWADLKKVMERLGRAAAK